MTEQTKRWQVNALLSSWPRQEYPITYKPGDILSTAFVTTVVVDAEDAQDACNKAWTVGNRMGESATGRIWSQFVRSMSVGDVLEATTWNTDPASTTYWLVKPMGFEQIKAPHPSTIKSGRQALIDGQVASTDLIG
jgi:hypothetical protein